MDPIILTPKQQSFLGYKFYLCGLYFQREGIRLHRVVWEHHNGPVPKGHHIHHRNEDRSDNRIANLECVLGATHLSAHSKGKPHPKAVAAMQEAAKAWHRSSAGREWHRGHYRNHLAASHTRDISKRCVVCGSQFFTTRATAHRAKFCGGKCRAAGFRKRRPSYYSAAETARRRLLSDGE